jgi:hypothetical protein
VLGANEVQITECNAKAIRAWTLLANGMGGIDWQGFERIAEHLCIDDDEWLIESLHAIRCHRPDDPPPDTTEPDAPTLS